MPPRSVVIDTGSNSPGSSLRAAGYFGLRCFAIYIDGNLVYAEETADALETALQPMVGSEFITRMSKNRYPRSWLSLMNQ